MNFEELVFTLTHISEECLINNKAQKEINITLRKRLNVTCYDITFSVSITILKREMHIKILLCIEAYYIKLKSPPVQTLYQLACLNPLPLLLVPDREGLSAYKCS